MKKLILITLITFFSVLFSSTYAQTPTTQKVNNVVNSSQKEQILQQKLNSILNIFDQRIKDFMSQENNEFSSYKVLVNVSQYLDKKKGDIYNNGIGDNTIYQKLTDILRPHICDLEKRIQVQYDISNQIVANLDQLTGGGLESQSCVEEGIGSAMRINQYITRDEAKQREEQINSGIYMGSDGIKIANTTLIKKMGNQSLIQNYVNFIKKGTDQNKNEQYGLREIGGYQAAKPITVFELSKKITGLSENKVTIEIGLQDIDPTNNLFTVNIYGRQDDALIRIFSTPIETEFKKANNALRNLDVSCRDAELKIKGELGITGAQKCSDKAMSEFKKTDLFPVYQQYQKLLNSCIQKSPNDPQKQLDCMLERYKKDPSFNSLVEKKYQELVEKFIFK